MAGYVKPYCGRTALIKTVEIHIFLQISVVLVFEEAAGRSEMLA
ncbi:MAG: hypothetical protein NTX52_14920 [Planctomycetota bacterium]|nr:hypothetical protein [Planctomycetota bacterium]